MTGPPPSTSLREMWSEADGGGPWGTDDRVVGALRGARWGTPRRTVQAVLVLTAVVVVLLAARWLMVRDEATPHAVAPVLTAGVATGNGVPTSPAGMGTPDPSGSASSTAAGVTVHVVGAVRRPGLVSLPGGSRVADAVDAAGGPAPAADLKGVNLARTLVDGEQVLVPLPGETVPPAPGVAAPESGATSASTQVNVNTATLSEFESLPGVGPVLAQRMLDWRAEHGRFSSVDELSEVSGIGDKMLENLRPHVVL